MKKTILIAILSVFTVVCAFGQLTPTITTKPVLPTTVCVNSTVTIQFYVTGTGTVTPYGNYSVLFGPVGGPYSAITSSISCTSWYSSTVPGTVTAIIPVIANGSYEIFSRHSSIPVLTNRTVKALINVLNSPDTPTITSNGSTAICPGATLQLTTNNSGSLNWSTGQTTQSITVNAAGTYTVSSANVCGTSVSNPFTVFQKQMPTVNILGTPTTGCDSLTLYSSGTYYNSLSWSSGQLDSTATFTNSGMYYAIATNTCGSVNSNTVSVIINSSPTVTVTKNSSIKCAGQIDTLIAIGANSYNWTIGGNTNTISINPTAQTVYNVSGTDLNGCSGLGSFTVLVNPLPALTIATTNTLLCVGQTATLSANGASTYTWSTSETINSISVSPTVSTTYTLTGNSNLGCSNAITFMQNVSLCTGVEVLENIGNFSIYPNPTKNTLFINSDFDLDKVEIINCFGSTVKKINLNGSTQIDISDLQNGIYFLKVFESNSDNFKSLKILKVD